MVNGEGPPRIPRDFKRRLRAAIHNRLRGRPEFEGESLSVLLGWAAHVHMGDPSTGQKYLDELARLDQPEAVAGAMSAVEPEASDPNGGGN